MSSNHWPSWLKRYLGTYRRDAALALLLGLVASGCAALLMFTSGYLISATDLVTTTLFSVMVPVACVQLFGFGRPLARYAERLVSHNWVLRVTSDLRVKLFRSIDAKTADPTQSRAAGEYLSILSDDVAHLQNLYLRVIFPTAIAYALAIGTAILFGFFSAPFALVILIALASICVLLPWCTLLATRALTARAKASGEAEQVTLTDDILGSVDWVLAGRATDVLHRHADTDRAIRRHGFTLRLRQNALSTVLVLALGALLCATIAWAGGMFGPAVGTREACWIAAFALGFFPLIEAFSMLPAAFSETTNHRASVARLDEYLNDDAMLASRTASPVESPEHAMELAGVEYAYPTSDKPTLKGIDLTLDAGQSTAVLGRSGAGKSTLAGIMAGNLAPQAGSVRTAGDVCYLGQTPFLFNRTLRANLKIGAPNASDDELIFALKSVGLEGKLESLPNGLGTVVGETGVGFSGGEAHRVAFARALLTDAPIVIVDEPFTALDPETESQLLATMLRVFDDRCLVVITHHLAQIDKFDRVVFISDGTVSLDGSPAALRETSDYFRTLLTFDRQ